MFTQAGGTTYVLESDNGTYEYQLADNTIVNGREAKWVQLEPDNQYSAIVLENNCTSGLQYILHVSFINYNISVA